MESIARLRRNGVEVIRPTLERGAHLIRIFRTVVNPSNAAFVTGDVIERCFHDVGQNPQLSHSSGSGSAEIV